MLHKRASVISYASKALSGDMVEKAVKAKKLIKKNKIGGPDTLKAAKKNVRQAKDAQMLIRGTAAAGLGGAYLANKKTDDNDSLIPKDY